MKTPVTLALALGLTVPLAFAQTAPAAKKTQAKKVAKAPVSASRQEARTKANQMASGIRAAERAMTPEELDIATQVHVGTLPCELGASVVLAQDEKSPGYFNLSLNKLRYRMHPVPTSTGAIRLEDAKAGAVWLQLANKSMLMNQKLGQRQADDCKSPAQAAVAAALEKNPAPSVLDEVKK